MKVYISGKIGEEILSEATIAKFKKAEDMLREKGHEPFNPCSEVWQAYLSLSWVMLETRTGMDKYAYYLLEDQKKLAECDAVYFLNDWFVSKGALSEHKFAIAIGKKLIFQEMKTAVSYLRKEWWEHNSEEFINCDSQEGTCDDMVEKYINNHLKEAWLPL